MHILRLPAVEGRTFVCGDIHGSYSCVTRFLKEIGFDFEKDRLICAGDLVDRGPENEACLKLLYEPWFYCCMGNHEHMMYHFSTGQPYGMYWSGNGGSWGTKYFKYWLVDYADGKTELVRNHGELSDDEQMMEFVQKVSKEKIANLPYMITVEKNDGSIFHVLHAELPPRSGMEITDEVLADPDKFQKLASVQSSDGDYITWGRYVFYSFYRRHLEDRDLEKARRTIQLEHKSFNHLSSPNLSPIYSGHTIVRQPVKIFQQTNLDTCAYGSYIFNTRYGPQAPEKWCGLTVTEPETGKFWFVNDHEFRETEPLALT